MNGAESLVRTLVGGGVNVCFANPGTSEMHFVAALDRVEGMRCVLGLFEGVVTAAADGYARMTDKPAATLLHLGPGLANGLANLHNAVKAFTPLINIVGDHATYHRRYDAPLTSDIEAAARSIRGWVRTSPDAKAVAADGAAAIAASLAPPGQVATLILPADTAWNEADGIATVPEIAKPAQVSADAIAEALRVLRSGEPTLILLAGLALRERGLNLAARIGAKTGARMMAQTFNSRIERGPGRAPIERIPYPVDQAMTALKDFKHVILVGSKTPVAFFAYPNKPSVLMPEGYESHVLSKPDEDGVHALEWLADELGAGVLPEVKAEPQPPAATGAINPMSLGISLGAYLPENAIIVDEAISTGRGFFAPTRLSRRHDWLQNMGGSIGIGLPLAIGAAIACPDRRVVCLEGDGSGMYTVQSLWTQARENLNITNVIFANRSYAILRHELTNVGAQNVGRKALDMLDLGRPDLDWVALARGMGVPATRVETMDEFNKHFAESVTQQGPSLIEVVM
ncbi:MAG TPA: acetolactate synthase large subunit [Xanthobacteraceae bacterium]|nr:acetolactate synthase large subunit [Xanthobacteraceae bacterium]